MVIEKAIVSSKNHWYGVCVTTYSGRIRNRIRNFLKIDQNPDPDPKLLEKSKPYPDPTKK
jgi:hypothetical protein